MKRIIFILFLSIVLLLSILLQINLTDIYVPTAANEIKNAPVIVIDCGHGGEDGGAVSLDGLVEKDVNLAIGISLQKLFIHGGFSVMMTRSSDTSIASPDAGSLREKKISDIHNRTDIANESNNNILISIHQNKFEDSKYYGTQVFYSKNNELSKELAEYIRLAVKGLLQNSNERQCKESTRDIYLLDNSKVPAVLVECGFLSNPDEEKKLRTEQYRNQIAFCIYAGFLEYYYQNY